MAMKRRSEGFFVYKTSIFSLCILSRSPDTCFYVRAYQSEETDARYYAAAFAQYTLNAHSTYLLNLHIIGVVSLLLQLVHVFINFDHHQHRFSLPHRSRRRSSSASCALQKVPFRQTELNKTCY